MGPGGCPAGLALVATHLPEALALAREAGLLYGDAGDRLRQANTLYTMASRALDAGVVTDEVRMWLDDSLELSDLVDGEHHRAHETLDLARLGWIRGDAGVEALLEACLPVLRRLGDLRSTGRTLLVAAQLAQQQGDAARGRRLLRDSISAARPAADHATLSSATALLGGPPRATVSQRRGADGP